MTPLGVLRRHERGEAAVLEMMFVIGLLLLPTVIGLAQLPRWIDARSTAELAAQEAARQMVLAPDDATGRAAAEAMARQIVVNHGWPESALLGVEFSGTLVRGGEITAHVTIEFPAIVIPPIGDVGGGMARTWSHTERVEDFREF
jgi:hypothetical protein